MKDKRTKAEDQLLTELWTEIDDHYLQANKLRLEATKHSVKAALLLEKAKEFLNDDEWSKWMQQFLPN